MNTLPLTLLACLAITAGLRATPACCSAPAGPDKNAAPLSARSLYQLDANWENDRGEIVTLAAFRGTPVIVAMIFTHCEYACPAIVADISRARAQLPAEAREKTRIVLVSFDSARDTPSVLAAYRLRMGLDASWTLLHGSPENVRELAMLLGVKFQQDARGQFSHSNLFTVLNAEGEAVHQQIGLLGDVAPTVKAIVAAVK